jgi:copper resistance protein C
MSFLLLLTTGSVWPQMCIRIRIASILLVIAGGFLLVGSASAHAKYERSVPGDGALVTIPPARVDIWFAQELFRRQGDNRIQVFDPGNQPVQVGEIQIDNDDRKHMWVELPAGLKPGNYRVDWNNLSAEDGDPDLGSFSFTFDPEATITSTVPDSPKPTGNSSVISGSSTTVPAQTDVPVSRTAVSTPETQSSPPIGGGVLLMGGVLLGVVTVAALLMRRRRPGGK